MRAVVHSFEGTGNQVLGDGIMALWGTPMAREDPTLHERTTHEGLAWPLGSFQTMTHTFSDSHTHVWYGLCCHNSACYIAIYNLIVRSQKE